MVGRRLVYAARVRKMGMRLDLRSDFGSLEGRRVRRSSPESHEGGDDDVVTGEIRLLARTLTHAKGLWF